MTKPSLGFVGVGRMGAPMVQRLLAAGFTVTICDPVPAAVDALVKQGASAAKTPRDVADQADIVFASVPTPNIVKQVAVGDDGVVHGKRIKIFVDLSTTGPKTSAEVNQALAAAARPVVIVLLDSWGKSTRIGDANRIKKWLESRVGRKPVG